MQFIIFRLGSEYFATETEKIQNISDIMQITMHARPYQILSKMYKHRSSLVFHQLQP